MNRSKTGQAKAEVVMSEDIIDYESHLKPYYSMTAPKQESQVVFDPDNLSCIDKSMNCDDLQC